MRTFAQTWPYDVKSDGKVQQLLTPTTASQAVSFFIEAPKGNVKDKWPKAKSLTCRLEYVIDQPAMGGAVINWDDLFRAIGSIAVKSELLGTLVPKELNGQHLKHIVEFVGHGYRYAGDFARAQVAAADGDTTIQVYVTVPFAPEYLERPEDAALWLGWLHNTEIEFTLAANSVFDGISTGSVIDTGSQTAKVQMWLDYMVSDELNVPVLSYWHKFSQNAGGVETLLRGFGGTYGLTGVEPYGRIAGIFLAADVKGMGGADGADNITGIECDTLGLKNVRNVDSFVRSYRELIGGQRAVINSTGSTPGHDGASNPEGLGSTNNGVLNSATLMYLALRAPSRNQRLAKLPKWNAGDLAITFTYGTTPSSGQHVTVTNEIKEFTPQTKVELVRRAGIDPSKAVFTKAGSDMSGLAAAASENRFGALRGLPDKVTRRG